MKSDDTAEAVYLKVHEIFPVLKDKTFLIKNLDPERYDIRRESIVLMYAVIRTGEKFRIITEEPITDIEKVEKHRKEILSSYDDTHELFLQREYLVVESLNQFDFSEKKIFVKFHGEQGHDYNGISRSFYSDFWEEFCKVHGKGGNKYFFSVKPGRSLTTKEIQSLANILITGYITTGYLPLFVNQALLYRLLSGKIPSSKFTTSSFMECLDNNDFNLIESALKKNSEFSLDFKTLLVNFFCKFSSDFDVMPNKNNFRECLDNIAFHVTFVNVWFWLDIMSTILERIQSPLINISELNFSRLMDSLKPIGKHIDLIPCYSPIAFHKEAEERVFGFVRKFVNGLNGEDTALFLKFCTGFEKQSEVYVEFSSEILEELMLPVAHVCGSSVSVSRYFLNENQLFKIFGRVLRNRDSWRKFEIM